MAADTKLNTVLHRVAHYLSSDDYHRFIAHIPNQKLAELVHVENYAQRTALHEVVNFLDPCPRTLQLFKELGANFNATVKFETSVLMEASEHFRSLTTLEQLILHGAEWTQTSKCGWGVIHTCLKCGNFPAFQFFCLRVLNQPSHVGEAQPPDGITLHQTISEAMDWIDLEDVDLRKLSINVNVGRVQFGTGKKDSLFHLSVYDYMFGKTSIIKLLLHSGVNASDVDSVGSTAVDIAVRKCNLNPELLTILESRGAINSQRLASTALRYIATRKISGHELVVDKILTRWPQTLEDTDRNQNTLLHIAANSGSVSAVTYFLGRGAVVDRKNAQNRTPLHCAIRSCGNLLNLQDAICKLLVDHGAELKAVDDPSESPLNYAITYGKGNVVQYLVSTGAYDDTQTLLKGVFEWAKVGDLETFQTILSRFPHIISPVEIDLGDGSGTLLHRAARNTDNSIFEYLFKEGGFHDSLRIGDIVHEIVKNTIYETPFDYVKRMMTGLYDDYEKLKRSSAGVNGATKMIKLISGSNKALLSTTNSEGIVPLLCENVHVDLLISLIDNGAAPLVVDTNGENVLFHALRYLSDQKFEKLVKHLIHLGHGQLLNARNSVNAVNGATVLHQAVAANDWRGTSRSSLELFNKYGEGVNVKDDHGESVLMYAVRQNKKIILLTDLIEMGANVKATNNDNAGLLHVACLEGNLDAVKLLASLCDVNMKDDHMNTPLHFVLTKLDQNRSTMAQILVSQGAALTARNKQGQSPLDALTHVGLLHLAAYDMNEDALRYFIGKGCDVNGMNKEGVLPICCYRNSFHISYKIKIVSLFLESKADINAKDSFGRTLVHKSCKKSVEMMNYLIANGADAYATDHQGRNMMHFAAESMYSRQFEATIRWIREKSMETLFNQKDTLQRCPIQYAVINSKLLQVNPEILLEIIDNVKEVDFVGNNALFNSIKGKWNAQFLNALISKGAEWNRTNNSGNGVLHVAAAVKNVEALHLFILKGCNVNSKNKNGETPLHCAIIGDDGSKTDKKDIKIQEKITEIVRVLLENNGDANSADSCGRTPISVAAEMCKLGTLDSCTLKLLEKK